jgi:glycerophosphoryl diester phosphodiesterase
MKGRSSRKSRVIVIGHGGASALAPANSLASFDAALEAGVDMIEFDVRRRDGDLLLAHLGVQARGRGCLSLEQAVAHLCAPRFSRVGLNVDIKRPGYEREVLDRLRAHGVLDRSLVSSQFPAVIDRLNELDRGVPTAISLGGRVARRARRWSPRTWREALLAALDSGRFGDVMLQHKLVDAELCAAVAATGRRLFAWTVNDPGLLERLAELGIAGVTTNDPRALAPARPASAAALAAAAD